MGLSGVPVVLFGRRRPLDIFQTSIEEHIGARGIQFP